MKFIALALLLLSWLNPLHIGPWVSWHNEVLAFAAMCVFFAAVLLELKKQNARFRIPYSALVWPALALLALLQTAMGQIEFFGDDAVLLCYFGLAFCAATSGFNLDGDRTSVLVSHSVLRQLAVVIFLGAALSAFLAFIQTLDVWFANEWISRGHELRRPGGNIAQPNQLATLLLMGIVSLNYLFSRGHVKGVAALLSFALLLAGLGLTESRSGVLGAASLLAFALLHRKRALAGLPTWYALAGFVFLLACFKFLPILSHQLQLGGAPLAVNLNAGMRLTVWPQLIEASLQHPWLGWGLRQVSLAHNAVLHNYSLAEPFTYAHNIVLDLVLGLGYPLGIAAVGLFCFWALKRLRPIADPHVWYCMALLIPLVLHSLLEFPFAYAYFLMPVALAVGVLEARLAPTKYLEVKWGYALAGQGLFTLVLLWSVWEYIAVEEDFRTARFEVLRIGQTAPDYERPTIVMLTQLQAALVGMRLVPEPGMSADRIDAARKVAMRFPWSATQNRYALSLALNGNADEAVRQLKAMRAMHGEKAYQTIKSNWQELANDKYPQLKDIAMP